MNLLRGLAAVATCAGLTILLVLGTALPSTASPYQYWSGLLIQNQVKFSPTFSIVGGQVVMDPLNRVITVNATVSGVGSYASVGSLSYSHTRRTTYAYCKWTSDYTQGVKYHLSCSVTT